MIFNLFGGAKRRNEELRSSAREGKLERVSDLIKRGADVNDPDPDGGETALIKAVGGKHSALVAPLLAAGANVNAQAASGHTALIAAAAQGDDALPMVDQLLMHGASIDLGPKQGDNSGATALYVAATRGANRLVARLLKGGASPLVKLDDGSGLLHAAAMGGNEETVQLVQPLVPSVDAVNQKGWTALHVAAITGNRAALSALLDLHSALECTDQEGATPLLKAAANNKLAIVEVLLSRGANLNAGRGEDGSGMNSLYIAALNGFDDIAQALIDAGAQVDVKFAGLAPMIDVAKQSGHDSMVKLLTAARKRERARTKAVEGGKKLWADFVKSVNEMDLDGMRTVAASNQFSTLALDAQLMVQALLRNADAVRVLLAAGANPNAHIDELLDGIPVLFMSSGSSKSAATIELLLAAGATADAVRADGTTALQVAVKSGSANIARLLLEKGANPNRPPPDGLPFLLEACIAGNQALVDVLLDGGAEIDLTVEPDGLCAFGVAVDNKRMKLAEHLLVRGAKPNYGDTDTLPLAVAEWGSLSLIKRIESMGGSVVTPELRGRVAFVAARNKDCEVLDHLLNHGADLNHDNKFGYTPLILSALTNHPSLVKRYLDRGDNAGARDVDRESALSLAIEKDHSEVIALLRNHGAELGDYPGLTPLDAMQRAAMDGSLGTILNLHDDGYSINSEDSLGNTPLMLAAKAGHLGVVRSLFHLGASVDHQNHEGKSASDLAKLTDDELVLKTLMEFGAADAVQAMYGFGASDTTGPTATFDAGDAFMGRLSHPFKRPPPYEESSESDDDERMQEAADEENEEHCSDEPTPDPERVAQLEHLESLLDLPHVAAKLSPPNRQELLDVIEKVREGNFDEVGMAAVEHFTELLESLPEVEPVLQPIIEAARDGLLADLKKQIKGGADVNAVEPDGTTALMLAAQDGHVSIVAELIKCGANVNQRRDDSLTALIIACFVGHEDIVKALLKGGAEINAGHSIGSSQGASGNQTCLTVAAQRGNLSMCKLLVKLGADVNVVSDSGYTPLMWSLANGASEEIADFLLRTGVNADPDAECKVSFATSTTPLVLAATNGLIGTVRELIRRKVRLDKTDGDGHSALKQAANSGHAEVVNVLIKAGASVDVADHEGWTALMSACGHGYVEIAKALLKAGADVKAVADSGVTALSQATGARADARAASALQRLFGNSDDDDNEPQSDTASEALKLVRLLLKTGANPNVMRDGTPLLEHAQSDEDEDLVNLLKKHGAAVLEPDQTDVPSDTTTSVAAERQAEHVWDELGEELFDAVLDWSVNPIAEILGRGANIDYVNSERKTALAVAVFGLNEVGMPRQVRRGLKEVADYLIRRGAGLNVPGCDPTPLAWAATAGELHLVNAMLQRGANPEARLLGKTTALLTSIAEKREDCALALIAGGADVRSRTLEGKTALHMAAAMSLSRVVDMALSTSPELVNSADAEGFTPLMLAAWAGNEVNLQSMLRHGAMSSMKNSDGKTAADLARTRGHDALAEMLS